MTFHTVMCGFPLRASSSSAGQSIHIPSPLSGDHTPVALQEAYRSASDSRSRFDSESLGEAGEALEAGRSRQRRSGGGNRESKKKQGKREKLEKQNKEQHSLTLEGEDPSLCLKQYPPRHDWQRRWVADMQS
jgi:hypothetical protein